MRREFFPDPGFVGDRIIVPEARPSLERPFRAVAADIETGEAVVLSRGSVSQSMRASMSVPGGMAPVEIDGRLLVDGGIANNLPIDEARKLCADVIIAVNISTPPLKREEITSALSVSLQLINFLGKQTVERQLKSLGDNDVLIAPDLGNVRLIAVSTVENRILKTNRANAIDEWKRGAVFVSEPFANRHNVKVGDRLTMTTERGTQAFEIPALAGPGTGAERAVYVLDAVGSINPGLADHIVAGIRTAEQVHAEALVIRLDTPGGLDASMRQIDQAIINSKVPVIVYVSPKGARAASAGVFVTIAAHVAAMAPGTNLGAAHPVGIGLGKMDKVMTDKAVNDMVAHGRALALERGRNADWVEKAVRKSVSIDAAEALRLKVIDFTAEDLGDLLAKVNALTVKVAGKIVKLKTPMRLKRFF